jgi:hypothetical protein
VVKLITTKKGHQKYVDTLLEQIENNIIGKDEEIDIHLLSWYFK